MVGSNVHDVSHILWDFYLKNQIVTCSFEITYRYKMISKPYGSPSLNIHSFFVIYARNVFEKSSTELMYNKFVMTEKAL